MKTYDIKVTEHTIDFRYRDIDERVKLSWGNFTAGDMDNAATQARLLADSANELACLLTQIARAQEGI